MRDAKNCCAASRIVEVVNAAATLRMRCASWRIHLHGDADNVVSGFNKQTGGDSRIDSAAHRGDYPWFYRHSVAQDNSIRGVIKAPNAIAG